MVGMAAIQILSQADVSGHRGEKASEIIWRQFNPDCYEYKIQLGELSRWI